MVHQKGDLEVGAVGWPKAGRGDGQSVRVFSGMPVNCKPVKKRFRALPHLRISPRKP